MLNSNVSNVKTYVGTDGKLHFTDSAGADTALNFKSASNIASRSFKLELSYGSYLWVYLTATASISNGAITISNPTSYLASYYKGGTFVSRQTTDMSATTTNY